MSSIATSSTPGLGRKVYGRLFQIAAPVLMAGTILAGSSQARAKGAAWVHFTAKDGSFTATVPAKPVQKQSGPKTYLWSSGSPKSVYLFGYTPIADLGKSSPENQKAAVKAFTNQFVKSANVKQTSSKELNKNGNPGLEITGTMLQMPMEARVLAMTKTERIYIEIAIGKTDKAKFFSGFKIK